MPKPLRRAVLEQMQCGVPGRKHEDHSQMFFHGRCHMKADVQAAYVMAQGIIRITCAECDALIAEVAVAR